MTALASNVQHCVFLKKLELSFNHISDAGVLVLAGSLEKLLCLKALNIQIGDDGVIAVIGRSKVLSWSSGTTD